ncbi:MAG: T9SS type A sorting domain-containing protein, partial [Bacteroidales bacterium]|nr:T9SS type A sorting domain-containing protein [Bacteroidales bacterium]
VYDIGESDPTTKMVQVGSPQLVFDPESITDTLTGSELSVNTLTLANNGFIDLEWEIASKPDWVTVTPASGFVEVGDPQDIQITLNSEGLINGVYNQNVVFEVNDQNNPFVNFPVNLVVDGQKSLTFSVDTLDFGVVPVSEQKYKQVYVINDGNFPVEIFSTYSNLINFQPQLNTYMLMPGDSGVLTVAFTPTDLSSFPATVFIEDYATFETWELPVTGTGGLAPPNDLSAMPDSNTVNLTWYPPGTSGDYLTFSGEEFYTAIGLSGGGTFEVASRFTPQDLLPYTGKMLEKIGFILWDPAEEVTLMVYSGENAENLLLEQDVAGFEILDWTDVELTTPISIDAVDYLWIGYKITHNQDQFPAGVDAGPAATGSGDLLSLDGVTWETLTYYGLSYNWNIRGSVADDNGESMVLTPKSKVISDYAGQNAKIASAPANKFSVTNNFLGYRIYRNDVLLNDSVLISETNYTDLNLDPGIYSYEVSAVYELGESLPAGPVEVVIEDPALFPAGWTHHHTPMTHIIHIPTQSVQGAGFMNEGDWIGVFYSDNGQERCGGNVVWADNDSLKLIVYGDNPATPVKEGFTFGEWMNWKVFMSQTDEEFNIDVDYNNAMPQYDGMFYMLGESALESVNLTTGIADLNSVDEPMVFPNPARSQFSVNNLDGFETIRLMDVRGNEVLNRKVRSSTEKIRIHAEPGLYYLVLEGNTIETRKVIITK